MSIHISAAKGAIARTVLMPGDPLRAQYMAEKFLQNPELVSQTRNVLYYTGTYKDKPISIGASGMGCPSIGIYSYELYTEYEVDNIIRIGTCGAYTTDLKLYDLVNVDEAASESNKDECIRHQGRAFKQIKKTARKMNLELVNRNIHSSDIFYRKSKKIPKVAERYECVAVEMESFALFANAAQLGKTAACILTVSDIIPTHEKISADEREKSLLPMMELALEAAMRL